MIRKAKRPLCDWWLESRRKCRRSGIVSARDEGGAPLHFCRQHWPLAGHQYRGVTIGPRSGA